MKRSRRYLNFKKWTWSVFEAQPRRARGGVNLRRTSLKKWRDKIIPLMICWLLVAASMWNLVLYLPIVASVIQQIINAHDEINSHWQGQRSGFSYESGSSWPYH